ncbi:MAG: hypothetical protein H0U95_16115 [Bacteroidetes bacterium]|nr:hypothetical protein [Bacteroidota bacterium]
MSENIIKGPISNTHYKKAFDEDGIEYKSYDFTLDGKKFNCKVPRLEHLSDGEIMIVEYKKTDNAYEMVSGLHIDRNYKWGNASALKAHKNEADGLNIVEGKIIEKQVMRKVRSSSDNNTTTKSNFNIVLENTNFTVPGYIGEKLKRDDLVTAVVSENYASIIYNRTTHKCYGVKYPYYIAFILAAIVLPLVIFYLQSISNHTFVRPTAFIVVFDVFFAFAALINFISYRQSNIIKRFLNKHLNK